MRREVNKDARSFTDFSWISVQEFPQLPFSAIVRFSSFRSNPEIGDLKLWYLSLWQIQSFTNDESPLNRRTIEAIALPSLFFHLMQEEYVYVELERSGWHLQSGADAASFFSVSKSVELFHLFMANDCDVTIGLIAQKLTYCFMFTQIFTM